MFYNSFIRLRIAAKLQHITMISTYKELLYSSYKESFYNSFIHLKIAAEHVQNLKKGIPSTSEVAVKQAKQSACI